MFHPENSQNAFLSLQDGKRDGFDYVVTELPVPIGIVAAAAANGGVRKGSTSVRTDVKQMDSRWWSTSVVGIVGDPPHWKTASTAGSVYNSSAATGSELTEVLTSSKIVTPKKKQEAEKIFWGMLEWASHMCIPAVILPTIPLGDGDSKTIISSSDEEDMFDDPSDNKPQDQTKTKNVSINNTSAKEYARLVSQLSTSSICSTSSFHISNVFSATSCCSFIGLSAMLISISFNLLAMNFFWSGPPN